MNLADAERIFHEALGIASPEERAGFVGRACGDDAALLEKVQRLLDAHEDSREFLASEPGNRDTAVVSEGEGSVIDRYKLLQKIGEGGFGVVYMAEQKEPVKRRVALKILKAGMDTKQVVARFEAERQALAMMDHPNIAKVLDGGATATGRPYFVMELVRGIPLTEYCDENRLTTRERLDLFMTVCHAVQHAHQKGVIHRDLKPSNILITLHDGVPVPKVIDFGIARATQQELTEKTLFTQFHQMIGTPAYVSPEQAEMSGLDIDTRADIYSLGVLLYELLTGATPLNGKDLLSSGYDEIRRRIREQEPLKPSTRARTLQGEERTAVAMRRRVDPTRLGAELKGDLDWIVMKALEKDRSRRYDTAKGLANDIRRCLNHEPVEAAAPSVWYQGRKWIRRHRTAFVATSVVTLSMIAGIVASVSQAIRATHASEREHAAHESALESLGVARAAEDQAERERRRAEALLTQLDMDRAEDYFADDRHDRGLASLARALRREPSNRAIAGRLVAALSEVSHILPTGPSMEHPATVRRSSINRDGSLVLTVCDDGTAYLWSARTSALIGRITQESPIQFAVFNPDGNRAATASQRGAVRIWHVPECEPDGDLIEFGTELNKLIWSANGRWLAGGGRNGNVYAYDLATLEPALSSFQCGAPVLDIDINLRGDLLAAGCEDSIARVWNLENNAGGFESLEHSRLVTHVCFSPDGTRLLTASHDGRLRLWDTASWTKLFDVPPHATALTAVQFDRTGSRIASASWDNTTRVIDAATGRPITDPLVHDEAPSCLSFLAGGELLVTGSRDARVRLWDIDSGKLAGAPVQQGFLVLDVDVYPEGARILTASGDRSARPLDARAGNAFPLQLRLNEPIAAAMPLPDTDRILIAGPRQLVKWSPADGRHKTTAAGFQEPIHVMSVDTQGSRAAVSGNHGRIRVVKLDGGSVVREMDHRSAVNSIEFSADGRLLLTAGETARVWRLNETNETSAVTVHARVSSARFRADGSAFVTASWDRSAIVWDAWTGEALTPPMTHELPVLEAAFDPTGKWIATASRDQTVGLWDAATGEPHLRLPHRHQVEHVQFSPDGRTLAAASGDHQVTLWRVSDGTPVTPTPLQHSSGIRSMTFSDNGRWLATATHQGAARVWSVRDGRPLISPVRHAGPVSAATFIGAGRALVTTSWDGVGQQHDLPLFTDSPPAWLADLAEAVGGLRFTGLGGEQAIPVREFIELRKAISSAATDGEFGTWARWFLADRSTRDISYRSGVSVREYIDRRLQENHPASLRAVLRINPSNTAAFEKLQALKR